MSDELITHRPAKVLLVNSQRRAELYMLGSAEVLEGAVV